MDLEIKKKDIFINYVYRQKKKKKKWYMSSDGTLASYDMK